MSIGLALAGGGLKGIAYAGAFKALEELEIKIDYLSGTSSGSIFATFYAAGFSPDEIKQNTMENYKSLVKIYKRNIIKAGYTYATSGTAKIEGLMPGENIERLVKKVISKKNIKNINEVRIPLAIATVDTENQSISLELKFLDNKMTYNVSGITNVKNSYVFIDAK